LILLPLGWTQVLNAPPLDVRAVGTLTHYSPDGISYPPVNFTVKCRGSKQYRLDIQTAKGMTTTIVNDIGGAFIATDGGVRTLSSSSAVSIRPPIFPFLLDALNLNDTRTHVSDSGPLLPSGLRQQVRARLDLGPDVMSQLRGRASDTVLWLGADNRPMRIDFVRVAADNHYVTVPFSLLVSDYRVVNGIAIAFRQEEQLQGRTVKVMTFQTVQLGPSAAVSDSDFRVPSAAPGGAQ